GSSGSNTGTIFPNAGANSTNTQDIYGLYVTLKAVPNWTVEPYYFLLKDSRVSAAGPNPYAGALTAFSPQAPDQARNVLGGRINGQQGIAGSALDATLEVVWHCDGVTNVV